MKDGLISFSSECLNVFIDTPVIPGFLTMVKTADEQPMRRGDSVFDDAGISGHENIPFFPYNTCDLRTDFRIFHSSVLIAVNNNVEVFLHRVIYRIVGRTVEVLPFGHRSMIYKEGQHIL